MLRIVTIILLCLINIKANSEIPQYISSAVSQTERMEQDYVRDETSKPAELMTFFGIKQGMKVLDFLSGDGYWSELISHMVGESGEVTAHSNQAYFDFIGEKREKRLGNNRLPGVKILISEIDDMQLKENTYDMIYLGLVYHDIYYVADYWPEVDRDNYLGQLYRALKPGGILAVVDHSAENGSGSRDAQEIHRIDPEFARNDLVDAGFIFQAESELLQNLDDDRTKLVFDESIRGRTDRFVYRFTK
jgi:predicted methyltransferase